MNVLVKIGAIAKSIFHLVVVLALVATGLLLVGLYDLKKNRTTTTTDGCHCICSCDTISTNPPKDASQ